MIRKTQFAVAVAALMAAPAFAGTTVDANAEFDTGYYNQGRGSQQGGRIEVNIAGKAEKDGYFVAGRGTAILAKGTNNTAGVDDAWVQIGSSMVDVKLGRFEAADLWPTPGDVVRVGGIYTTNILRGRATYNNVYADDRFHAAVTANLAPGTSLEVGLVDKKSVGGVAASAKGIRPSIGFSAGGINARVGGEFGSMGDGAGNTSSFNGLGATASMAFMPGVTGRINLASGKTNSTAAVAELKRSAMLLGVDVAGVNLSVETGKDTQGAVTTKRNGLFAAYTMPLFDIKGASVAPAIGTQSTDVNGVKTTDTRLAVRVHYDF
ncbi:carbohydrate porin [Sphaerotilus sp.]|uniref:carbohydrate porin n=1 Tax=Sphaerotilus sp. TaxID=2093942 RepID=UPI0034E1E2F3